ncbi:MFS transporter [Sulfitobacter mediterraneus]|uniref:MFS transporter n=1 Tax=Sulfitobacter mediterraneus TaxID=83219 RepID=UPI001932981B|nr:MFS transporter [Sulfitobacter mediterraneus]MBM1308886.1 MFS transporter [Sulfitobacter mediterraneus]MBM1312771.1 MFS transporter [Sulfitobacter mediterraneus]MBM1321153.1 MFS transporter [Sulfitobacter mediterraneus]MBM1325040.1 MFS transporter [Sulfitobacter mediterraneus]MBM1396387.1 MFS transporter [Sulfitobacter mediterraneus]
MNTGIFLLGLGYVLSQFFRAFLAVLSSILEQDIGATPDDLAFASGLWFLSFAAMQIPVGAALDSIGPRRTMAWALLVGGSGGAALFALATTPLHISIAMTLIGIGCSPVLMASYYIFARDYPPAQFAVLASMMVGLGSLGNLVASYPMALAAETLGWRNALWALAAVSALVAFGALMFVRDPQKVEGESKGSLAELFKLRALWFIFPIMGVSYAISGAVRGLWIGPYLADVFGAGTSTVGQASLLMGIAMVVGALAYGPADRLLPSRKWMIVAGTVITLVASAVLIAQPAQSLALSVTMLCIIGFFSATYPVIMAHGRSFLPPHLIGRGVTMLNLFSIGGVGIAQFFSGKVYSAALPGATTTASPYVAVYVLFAGSLAFGLLVYLFSRDNAD